MSRIVKKTNYFYIDESGGINNESNVFIHGCIKTDSPKTISEALSKLKNELLNSIYYDQFIDRIKQEGFHATENNIDMRADVYKLIPLLEYRAYFVIINKETEYFRKLKARLEEHEIFALSLRKLILDRIISNRKDKNIFYFEGINISKRPLSSILKEITKTLDASYDCEFIIVGKEEENLGVIDYLNFIFYQLLSTHNPNPFPRMKFNFDLVSTKIALIVIKNNNVYLSRKKKQSHQINLVNLMREFGG